MASFEKLSIDQNGKIDWKINLSNEGKISVHKVKYQFFVLMPDNSATSTREMKMTPLRGYSGIIPNGAKILSGITDILEKDVFGAYKKMGMIYLVVWFEGYPDGPQKCFGSLYSSSFEMFSMVNLSKSITCPDISNEFVAGF